MSDEQVVTLLKSAYSQGLSEQEIGMLLVQKGVTQEQLMRIKERGNNKENAADNSSASSRMRTVARMCCRGDREKTVIRINIF